jgi:2-(1,2-epoxy-1,2-dihydrophenyl)acetyl-CoA isomerase
MDYQTILLEIEAKVATITLNRPDKLNAMNDKMLEEIPHALKALGQDGNVNVIVITGAGKGFSSGGDLSMDVYKTTDPLVTFQFMDVVSDMIRTVRNTPQPVIAAVNGVAAGGGCNLALVCDMIVASDKARFSEIFVRGNLHPDSAGTYLLPRLVGPAKAMELMLTGRMVEAQEALEIGLVNKVVPADDLAAVAKEFAAGIAQAHPVVARMIKTSVYQGAANDMDAALEGEARAQLLIKSADIFKKK